MQIHDQQLPFMQKNYSVEIFLNGTRNKCLKSMPNFIIKLSILDFQDFAVEGLGILAVYKSGTLWGSYDAKISEGP